MNMRISTATINQRMIDDILKKQSLVSDAQSMIASGKQVNSPKDDPAQAGRLLGIEESGDKLNQFNRNSLSAETRLTLQETALTGVNDNLLRVRDLALSASNDTLDNQARSAIHAEISQQLEELYDLGNVKDSNGDYLFSGTETSKRPFSNSDPVIYSGNDSVREVPIGLGERITTGDPGSDVFMRIKDGNGDFSVRTNSANTGSGTIQAGSIVDHSLYSELEYTIEFTSPSTFDVIETVTGTNIQSSVPYNAGSMISISGLDISIQGAPASGDRFDISPSKFKDLFTTVTEFATALNAPINSENERAQQSQEFNNVILNLDRALEHINTVRSRTGTRLTSIDSRNSENSALQLQLQRTRAGIEDLDIAKAVTELQTRAISLEVLQKSYSRIENLSLFNYL